MNREVFVLSTGQLFDAWEIRFWQQSQHVEASPASLHERNGSISKRGTAYRTTETAEVKFFAYFGSIDVGQKGQLSTGADQFYEVEVSAVEAVADHAVISGRASRTVDVRFEWDD